MEGKWGVIFFMVYKLEDMRKDLESFKMNTLLRLQALEAKLDNLDKDEDEIKQEVKELEKKLLKDIHGLEESFELFKKEMPRKNTLKIVFTILGATISFLFASILRFLESLMT